MRERKFTDEEKILSLLKVSDDVYANAKLTPEEAKTLLDLINRQKAEIERLQGNYEKAMDNLKSMLEERADHSEAIKELAERLKRHWRLRAGIIPWYEIHEIINIIVKEMVGEEQ